MKGINPIEEHFDKGVVGLFAIALPGVIAWQVLLAGNTVSVGGKDVPLSDAFDPAEQAANRLKAELEEERPPLPEVAGLGPIEEWESSLGSSQVDVSMAIAFGSKVDIGSESGEEVAVIGTRRFAEFIPVKPEAPIAHAFRSTIDPEAAAEIEGLSSYLPTEQPFDTLAVSVQSSFSGTELRQLLERDPDGGGPLDPLPRSFWADNASIVGVEVERERLVDGEWSELTTLPLFPGQEDFLSEADAAKNVRALETSARNASLAVADVLTPEFPVTIAGDGWVVPSEVEPVSTDPEEIRLKAVRRRVRTELARAEARFEAQQELQAERDEQRAENERRESEREQERQERNEIRNTGGGGGGGAGRGGRGGGGGRGAGGGGAGGGRGGGGTTGQGGGGRGGQPGGRGAGDRGGADERDAGDPLAARQREIDTLRERLEEIEAQIADLKGTGVDADDEAKDITDFLLPGSSDILDESTVHLWTHDLTAEGGETYRYRVRLAMPNPLFGREASLAEDQKSLAQPRVARSAPSGWSEAVETSPDRYIYVTSASADNLVSGASVQVEIYGFYYGYWRRGEATLRPGDEVLVTAPLPEGLRTFDLESEARPENDEEGLIGETLSLDASAWLADVVLRPSLGNESVSTRDTERYEAYVAGRDGGLTVYEADAGPLSAERLVLLASVESGLEQVAPGLGGGGLGRGGGRDEDFGGRGDFNPRESGGGGKFGGGGGNRIRRGPR